MFHDFVKILGMERVENVKEVLTWCALTLWISIREILHECLISLELWIKVLDRKLIIKRNLHCLNHRLLEQVLLACKDGLEEVFVDHCLIRQIVLD
jgi:hypothetical protein